MSIFLIKSILALIFFAAALISYLAMMIQMGVPEKKINLASLRRVHKWSGFAFVLLLIIISYLCIRYLFAGGDQIAARAVFHSILSLFLLVIVFLKLTIIRFYKLFMKYVPALGMTVFSLSFVLTASSAGYYFLRTTRQATLPSGRAEPSPAVLQGDVEKGASLFRSQCAACHFTDRESFRVGPGLKGILMRKQLPVSHRPANPESVVSQLKSPFLAMPAFPSLSDRDIADLLAYLKTL